MSNTLTRPLADRVAKLPSIPSTLPAIAHELPKAVIDAAIQALADGKTHYTDRPGILPLREQIASEINRHWGLGLDADQVTVTCGVEEAIFACVKVMAESAIYLADESAQLRSIAALTNIPIIEKSDEIVDGTLIYFNGLHPQASAEEILARTNPDTCWVIWDITGNPPTEFNPGKLDHWLSQTIMTGSYDPFLPGWRIGWMAGSSKVGALKAFKQSMTICSPSISQWAVYGLEQSAS